MSDLRSKILAANDIRAELVEIPEWDVTVEVRSMTAADRARIIELAAAEDGRVGVGAMYMETVLVSVYDPESGERLFSDADRDAIMGKSAAAIDRLATIGMRLSGIDAEAQDNAKRQFPGEAAS